MEEITGNLAYDPRPAGARSLTGMAALRVRMGDYRVIYEVDDPGQAVTVVQVGHRREVYRR